MLRNVCVRVYIYVYICVNIYSCTYVCVRAYIYIYIYITVSLDANSTYFQKPTIITMQKYASEQEFSCLYFCFY